MVATEKSVPVRNEVPDEEPLILSQKLAGISIYQILRDKLLAYTLKYGIKIKKPSSLYLIPSSGTAEEGNRSRKAFYCLLRLSTLKLIY